jgi:hypothetical protein
MMNKNVALLSIAAALLGSLFLFDVAHAGQIGRKQTVQTLMAAEMNGAAKAPTRQVSNSSAPCTEDEMRSLEASCQKQSLPGSRGKTLDKILYTIAAITVTLVMTLVALILWVLMSRRIQLPPFVKGTH